MCTVHYRTTRNPGPGLARTWTWTRTCPEIWAQGSVLTTGALMTLCSNSRYMELTFMKICIPNTLIFQHHLSTSKKTKLNYRTLYIVSHVSLLTSLGWGGGLVRSAPSCWPLAGEELPPHPPDYTCNPVRSLFNIWGQRNVKRKMSRVSESLVIFPCFKATVRRIAQINVKPGLWDPADFATTRIPIDCKTESSYCELS
jgi:hypothetical protein